MEESSAFIRASNLEAVMSIEPEGEDDVVGILKSFMEFEEIPSPANMFHLGEPLFWPLWPGCSVLHKIVQCWNPVGGKSGSVVHGGETDSSDYEYSYNVEHLKIKS